MPKEGKQTKRRIIDAAYELFYKGGFARAGVDAIAEAAQVTKRTLYYHFPSKDALLAAVLDVQNELALQRVQRWAMRARGDPAAMVEIRRIRNLGQTARVAGIGFHARPMELADLPGHPARSAARRHKAAVEDWFAEQFAQKGIHSSGQVARQIMLLLEGCHSLVLIHGVTRYVEAPSRAARLLVEQHRLPASS